MMRSLIAAGAVLMTGLAATAPQAEAGLEISFGWGQSYISGHGPCGCPIYSKRVCTGYDRHHRPVHAIHREPFHCNCKHHKKHLKDLRKHEEKRAKASREYHEKRGKEYRKYQDKRRKEYDKHQKELAKLREKHFKKHHR